VSGLDFTSTLEAFGIMKYLIPLALTKNMNRLKAKCTICGKPAVYTKCFVEKTGAVLVGGAEAYKPICEGYFDKY